MWNPCPDLKWLHCLKIMTTHFPTQATEDTPFTYIDTPAALADAADLLRCESEIAVDLENHSYRSFQGFCCLMQARLLPWQEKVVEAVTDLGARLLSCMCHISGRHGYFLTR